MKSQGGANTTGIKKRRLELGIGQAELGRLIGVSPAAVLQMESPGCYPTADKLPLIAQVLRCSMEALYEDEPTN